MTCTDAVSGPTPHTRTRLATSAAAAHTGILRRINRLATCLGSVSRRGEPCLDLWGSPPTTVRVPPEQHPTTRRKARPDDRLTSDTSSRVLSGSPLMRHLSSSNVALTIHRHSRPWSHRRMSNGVSARSEDLMISTNWSYFGTDYSIQ